MAVAPDFLERLRQVCRDHHLSPRTEQAYLDWCYRYFVFYRKRAPETLSEPEVGAFLSYLATERRVAFSTQNQALCALLFLYRHVLRQPLANIAGTRVRRYRKSASVPKPEEIRALLAALRGVPQLVASLLYGTGLRLEEVLHLRLRDVDLSSYCLLVRATRAHPARTVPLPASLIEPVLRQFGFVTSQHVRDCAQGHGFVDRAGGDGSTETFTRDSSWQYLFPARRPLLDSPSGQFIRGRLHDSVIQRALKETVQRINLPVPVSCKTLRHCYAQHLLAAGCDIPTLQRLLGHSDVRSTLRYKHQEERPPRGRKGSRALT